MTDVCPRDNPDPYVALNLRLRMRTPMGAIAHHEGTPSASMFEPEPKS